MQAVRCESGLTQILEGLRAFLYDGRKAESIILISDCFEEEMEDITPVAAALRTAEIKVFCLLEGDN